MCVHLLVCVCVCVCCVYMYIHVCMFTYARICYKPIWLLCILIIEPPPTLSKIVERSGIAMAAFRFNSHIRTVLAGTPHM